ncbi:MAG: AAA family ATPase [Bacteroidaceae bacterium]|nr:AAA family ATPase [Bacteroidaceae bacterium]
MMNEGDFWDEITEVFLSAETLEWKYAQLYNILDRMCIQLVAPLHATYNGLFSRLQALCRIHQHPLHPVDVMRWRARQVKRHEQEPNEEAFRVDVKGMVEALACFTHTAIPSKLKRHLPDEVHPSALQLTRLQKGKRMRLIAVSKDLHYILAQDAEFPQNECVKVDFTLNDHTRESARYVIEGMLFNVVSYQMDREGTIAPELIVIEPDYLVNVSTLTSCFKPYGASAFNYLLKKFDKASATRYTLLGDVANQFLDDSVNSPDMDYNTSIKKLFRDKMLSFCTTGGIDASFFEETKKQFKNIHKVTQQMMEDRKDEKEFSVVLEPSFFCETLGLQGRFDMLSADYSMLLELKSGKKDEFYNKSQYEHILQMLLYKEILYYNLGIKQKDVIGYLLYSKYPELIEQRSAMQMIQEAMTLRNKIVCLEQKLVEGEARNYIPKLTAEKLKTNPNVAFKLWNDYNKPDIERILLPLQKMDALTADYFYTFFQFCEREHWQAKMGDGRIESTRAMSSLWNADLDLKRENGDIITDLRIEEMKKSAEDGAVESICLLMPDDASLLPNFRTNDSVILYERNKPEDDATNRQVVRCSVEKYEEDRIWLCLRYRQRNADIFPLHSLYAIEHDHLEFTFNALYAGLFSFVCTTAARRELLLCQREPDADKDFQLIVGPPGTGKTSVTLKRLVMDAHAAQKRVLLLAYTHRAVDEICEMLETTSLPYLRMGRELACDARFHQRLMVRVMEGKESRREILQTLGKYDIIVSTVASLCSHLDLFQIMQFHLAIFDEASQILEPQILPLLSALSPSGQPAIEKFIMIGDHKQLPAVVTQSEEESAVSSEALRKIGLTNCRNSLFERLHHWIVTAYPQRQEEFITLLHHQGRMHPHIAQFANEQFYEGCLQPVPLQHQMEELPFKEWSDDEQYIATHRVGFFHVDAPSIEERQAKMNKGEAEMIASIVEKLISIHRRNHIAFSPSESIGIIVPFRRQIATVRQALEKAQLTDANKMLIDTVERYQGSQKDIIIYGTTITRPYELEILSNLVEVEGKTIDRKLNVAVTRARKQLFVVGNRPLLSRNPLYSQLIKLTNNEK